MINNSSTSRKYIRSRMVAATSISNIQQRQQHHHHQRRFSFTILSLKIIVIIVYISICFNATVSNLFVNTNNDIFNAVDAFQISTITSQNTRPIIQQQSSIKKLSLFTSYISSSIRSKSNILLRTNGWKEKDGEWVWVDDDKAGATTTTATTTAKQNLNQNQRYQQPKLVKLPKYDFISSIATPALPAGTFKPKQSLGQNFLKDPNTVSKILRAFHTDAFGTSGNDVDFDINNNQQQGTSTNTTKHIVELGPGAGALTDRLVDIYGVSNLYCIEIDNRAIEILQNKHTEKLKILELDVLQTNYYNIAHSVLNVSQLVIIGNLPYYITSQILFALADASHTGCIASATVTMQKEVALRMIAVPSSSLIQNKKSSMTNTKDYGILSVVFQIYCSSIKYHFKIPPTVFYPKPKVDSALVGLQFINPITLYKYRLAGVNVEQLRYVIISSFQQRRKTLRKSLKQLLLQTYTIDKVEQLLRVSSEPIPVPAIIHQYAKETNDVFALQQIKGVPNDWSSKRPEELLPCQFIELTRYLYGDTNSNKNVEQNNEDKQLRAHVDDDEQSLSIISKQLGTKVWRKLKHGDIGTSSNDDSDVESDIIIDNDSESDNE